MNNKVLMSLVAASIAAMAAAPDLIREANAAALDEKTDLIKIQDSPSVDKEFQEDLQKQVDVLLSKKGPISQLSESVSVLVDNYGDENGSIKENIFKELNLGAQSSQPDSTHFTGGAFSTPGATARPIQQFCHSACHGACHSACHGSRGWR